MWSLLLTLTHRKQNICPQGNRAGCIHVCKQTGQSKPTIRNHFRFINLNT